MIPRLVHFVFGLNEDFAKIPFSLYHYLAVASVRAINRDYEVVVHYYYEPEGNEWWERCKQIAVMDKLEAPPSAFHGKSIKYYAHKTDWVRLDILFNEGGIYLDMDTICISPFDPLLGSFRKCVMGLEVWNGELTGLCNAVIMAEKSHPFLKMWQDSFSDFNPEDWNQMACRKPLELYMKHKSLVHIEPPESFFLLTWSEKDLRDAHVNVIAHPRSYSMHLWESKAYKSHLQHITEPDIRTRHSTYNILARRAFAL